MHDFKYIIKLLKAGKGEEALRELQNLLNPPMHTDGGGGGHTQPPPE